jgi:hypothetical protein
MYATKIRFVHLITKESNPKTDYLRQKYSINQTIVLQ